MSSNINSKMSSNINSSNIDSSHQKLTWNKSPNNLGVRKTNRFWQMNSDFFRAEPTKSGGAERNQNEGETKNNITGVCVVVIKGNTFRMVKENRVAMTKEQQKIFGVQPFMLPSESIKDGENNEINNEKIAEAIKLEIQNGKPTFSTADVRKLLDKTNDEIIGYAQNNAQTFASWHFPMVVCRERLKEGEEVKLGLGRLLEEEHSLKFEDDCVIQSFIYQRKEGSSKQLIYLVDSTKLKKIERFDQNYFCARSLSLFDNDILETTGGKYKTIEQIDSDLNQFKVKCVGRDISRWGQYKLWERCKETFGLSQYA